MTPTVRRDFAAIVIITACAGISAAGPGLTAWCLIVLSSTILTLSFNRLGDSPPVESKDGLRAVYAHPRQIALLAIIALTLTHLSFTDVIHTGRTIVSSPTLNVENEARQGGGFGYNVDPWAGNLIEGPGLALTSRELRRGNIPTWNPTEGCGTPHLGNAELGTLSVLQLPLNLSPSPMAWDLFALFRIALASFGAMLLAMSFGIPPQASLIAGLAFSQGGAFVLHANLVHLNTAAVIPFFLLSIEGLLSRQSTRRVLFCAAMTALAVNGGNPQPIVIAMLFALSRLLGTTNRTNAVARIKAFASSAGLALLLSAPSLLPLMDALAQSAAREDLGLTTALGTEALIRHIAPEGGAAALDHLWVGGVAWGLFVISLFCRHRHSPPRGYRWAVLAFLILIHVDVLPAALRWIHWVTWSKYVSLLHLLAGLGAATAVGLLLRSTRQLARISGVGLIALVALELAAQRPPPGTRPASLLPQPSEDIQAASRQSMIMNDAGTPYRFVAIADYCPPLTSGALGLSDIRSVTPLIPKSYLSWMNPFCNRGAYLRHMLLPETTEWLTSPVMDLSGVRWVGIRDHRLLTFEENGPAHTTATLRFGALHRALVPGTFESHGLRHLDPGNATFELEENGWFQFSVRPCAQEMAMAWTASFEGTQAAVLTINDEPFRLNSDISNVQTRRPITSSLHIKLIASDSPTRFSLDQWHLKRPPLKQPSDFRIDPSLIDRGTGTSVLINKTPLPIARLARTVIPCRNRSEMQEHWERLIATGEGWDYREEILVVTKRKLEPTGYPLNPCTLNWLNSDTFEVEVNTAAPGVLHVAITHDDNWTCTAIGADGDTTQLTVLPSNGPFMAVFLDSVGKQQIHFSHEPRAWFWSKWLFAAGVLLTVGIGGSCFANRGKREKGHQVTDRN